MDTSLLYEQLVWALRPDILDGLSAEAQKDMDKIHDILKEALEDAYEEGYEVARDNHPTG